MLSAIVLHCSYTENKVIALAGNSVQREGKKFNSYFILYSLTLNIYIFTLHINGSYALPQSAQKEAEEVTHVFICNCNWDFFYFYIYIFYSNFYK